MKVTALAALVVLASYAVSGCAGEGYGSTYGGGYEQGDTGSGSYGDSKTDKEHAVRKVSTNMGEVYATSKGMTLYTFSKDAESVSTCYGGCADSWPPFLASNHAKSWGAFTTIERNDGSYQWAYNKQPLYTWVGDRQEGDTNGHGVNNVWYAAQPMH